MLLLDIQSQERREVYVIVKIFFTRFLIKAERKYPYRWMMNGSKRDDDSKRRRSELSEQSSNERENAITKPFLSKLCNLLYMVITSDVIDDADVINFLNIINQMLEEEKKLGDNTFHKILSSSIFEGEAMFDDKVNKNSFLNAVRDKSKQSQGAQKMLVDLIKILCNDDEIEFQKYMG
ncbi:hypothetical protein AKO1_015664, partial [Acrasis kona]